MANSRLIAGVFAVWLTSASLRAQPPVLPPPPPPPVVQPVAEPFATAPAFVPTRWQLQIDPLVMWYSRTCFPPLVTTGQPITDPSSTAIPGAIGDPSTRILVGARSFGGDGVGGLRATLAFAFTDVVSIDVGGFFTQTRTETIRRASDPDGSPILARPFRDANTGLETVDQYRAYPDWFAGSTTDSFTSRLWGLEGNLRWALVQTTADNAIGFDVLAGVRYFQLTETYTSFDSSVDIPFGTGFSNQFSDTFGTSNDFIGGQLGAVLKLRMTRASVDLTGKLVAGNNSQMVDIRGFSSLTSPTGVTATDSNLGLFAQPSNIGCYNRDAFSVGGEFGVKFGYQFTDSFRMSVGYTLFTIGNVVRPGEQIDRVVNIQPMFATSIVGPARPMFLGRESTFTTQTLNLGFEFLF